MPGFCVGFLSLTSPQLGAQLAQVGLALYCAVLYCAVLCSILYCAVLYSILYLLYCTGGAGAVRGLCGGRDPDRGQPHHGGAEGEAAACQVQEQDTGDTRTHPVLCCAGWRCWRCGPCPGGCSAGSHWDTCSRKPSSTTSSSASAAPGAG